MAQSAKQRNTYARILHITHEYLGITAERFIDRQIRNHLNKEPHEITQKDLRHLIDWIRLSVSLLTDDTKIVEEYMGRLNQLAS